jgi:hypothetical protein
MKDLKVKQELLIDDKIFTKENIISLIELVVKSAEEILAKSTGVTHGNLEGESMPEIYTSGKHTYPGHSCIEFTTEDNLKLSFSFEEKKEAIEILNNKRIVEVELFFSENILNSKFMVKLRAMSSSYFRIEGTDQEWVAGTIKLSKDFLAQCRPQSLFVKKFRIQIIAAIILLLTIFLLNIVQVFIKTQVSFPKIVGSMFREDLGYYIIFMILISAAPAVFIYRWLRNLFPIVDIQTGEDSNYALRNRRMKLLLIASVIILPTILSFLLRLL